MARAPIFQRISFLAITVHVALFLALVWAYRAWWFGAKWSHYAPVAAALTYAAVLVFLRCTLAAAHRRGMRLVRGGKFQDAIEHLDASYKFFSRHAWVDHFRALTLFSLSGIGYREMALVNAAFCHIQTGQVRQARELYERAAAEFPESGMAAAALKMLDAGTQGV